MEMATPSGNELLSPLSLSPSESRRPVKYRAACDYCQRVKSRCSQGKPACNKCANRGIPCVYSPVKRMGRPRKTPNQAHQTQETAYDDYEDEAGLASNPTSISGDRGAYSTSSGGGGDSGTATGPTSISSSSTNSAPPTRQATVGVWDSGPVGQENAALANNGHAVHFMKDISQHSSIPSETLWRHPIHPFQVNDATITTSSDSVLVDHGYIAVLTTLANLEQSVTLEPETASVELVLRAERDFRKLKHRIFTCRDYTSYGEGASFLAAKPPALLALSLLAERIVSMLETKFRATVNTLSARFVEQDVSGQEQMVDLTRPASLLTSGNQQAAATARRFERSFRGLLDQPCVFPVPGGNAEIRFGAYVLSMPATARGIKAILQVRLRKMLATLIEMQDELQRQSRAQVDVSRGLLDWGNSDALLRGSASDIVQNLVRRVESLQGAMVLIG